MTTERILACPHKDRHRGSQPLYDGPLCPLCRLEVDVIGEGETGTGLLCPCGWGFMFNPSPSQLGAAHGARVGAGRTPSSTSGDESPRLVSGSRTSTSEGRCEPQPRPCLQGYSPDPEADSGG